MSRRWDSKKNAQVSKYLWVVFGVSRMQGDRLEVQAAIEIDRGNDVSSSCKISIWVLTTDRRVRPGIASGSYILQRRNNTTDTTLGGRTRSRSRRRGSHPITVLALSTLLPIDPALIDFRRGRREITRSAWEGKRAGGDERLCLSGRLRVGLNLMIHDCRRCDGSSFVDHGDVRIDEGGKRQVCSEKGFYVRRWRIRKVNVAFAKRKREMDRGSQQVRIATKKVTDGAE